MTDRRPLSTLVLTGLSKEQSSMKSRDLMAPNTDPTDEELALVMREARELAVQRRAKADAWVADRLKEAAQFARENAREARERSGR